MLKNWIEPEYCQFPDQASAEVEFRIKLHKKTEPIPYLFIYKDTSFRNLCWIDEADSDVSHILPAFGTHEDDRLFWSEDHRLRLQEGSFFRCQGEFYILINTPRRGLSLKQITIIDTPEMLKCFAQYMNVGHMEFVLCKASEIDREHSFVAYVWSGYYLDDEKHIQYRAPLPVFVEDALKLAGIDPWSLLYEPLSEGKILNHDGQNYLVKSCPDGLYIDELVLGCRH